MTENQMIAKVIAAQLGGGRFVVMTGANRMLAVERGLQFKLPSNFAKDGINCVEVKLNDRDLYDLSFKRIRGLNVTLVAEAENIDAEALRGVFAEATSLAVTHERGSERWQEVRAEESGPDNDTGADDE